MSACRQCGAPIRWVKTAKHGKQMPLDAEPTPEGTVLLRPDDGAAVVLDIPDRDRLLAQGAVVYRAHFASCPHYRKEKQP